MPKLDATERNECKNSITLSNVKNVSEYLLNFLKVPSVESKLLGSMGNKIDTSFFYTSLNVMEKSPSLLSSFVPLWISGKWIQPNPDTQFDTLVSPNNISICIQAAFSQLPKYEVAISDPSTLEKTIGIFRKGIELNPTSDLLWSFYLDISGIFEKESQMTELFELAILSVPSSLHIRWSYYLHEKDVTKKLEKLLELVTLASTSQEINSTILVTLLAQLFSSELKLNSAVLHKACMCIISGKKNGNLLDESTNIRDKMTPDHYAFFVLLYTFHCKFGYLPSNLFYEGHHSNLVKCNDLFLIPWEKSGSERSINNYFIDQALTCSLEYITQSSPLAVYYILLRNRVEFLEYIINVPKFKLIDLLYFYYRKHSISFIYDMIARYNAV